MVLLSQGTGHSFGLLHLERPFPSGLIENTWVSMILACLSRHALSCLYTTKFTIIINERHIIFLSAK
jgi:hypothetical protein